MAASMAMSSAAYGADAGAASSPDGGAPPAGGDAGVAPAVGEGAPTGASQAGAADAGAAEATPPAEPPPAPAAVPVAAPEPPPAAPVGPQRIEPFTVVGTRESRTPGSAHVLRPRDLERMDYDNPESVTKQVPGVYARGEDGFGLRPNIGIRGVSPDRSKKVTLMEDGILFGPAPYAAPAAYYFPLITRMELVRVIKGPGSVSFGPQTVGGAIDLVTRSIPPVDSGAIDVAGGAFGYGKLHGHYGASTARSGYVLEGVHLRSTGFKDLDGGGDTGFEKHEWMWKGRYLLSTNPNATQTVGLKLGYASEDARESYLGLTDADFRATPYRRYRASMFDRMQWHRTQIAATYHARLQRAFTIDAAVYRNDMTRTWRKVNRMGYRASIADILLGQADDPNYPLLRGVLAGELDSSDADSSDTGIGTIYIGPNRREFVSQGVQTVVGWTGTSGPISHRAEAGVRYHYDRIDRLHTEDGYRMQDGTLVRETEQRSANSPRVNTPTLTTANARAWVHALALHVADAASVGPLTLTPGVRVELIDGWERDRLSGTEIRGATQRVVIPGMGAYVAALPSLGIFAGVHRGFSPAAPGQPLAKPETSVNYEAGLRLSPPRVRLEAIGFFNDYQNLTSICTIATCGQANEGMQTNAGRAHIYGTELFARTELSTARVLFPIMASYTFTRAELRERPMMTSDPTLMGAEPGDELPFIPRHQAAITTAVESTRGALAVAGTYVSAMRERVQGDLLTAPPRTDPSFILDVTARVNVALNGHVYLSVRNVLGAEDIAARLPMGARPVAPRWIQVGTKWSF